MIQQLSIVLSSQPKSSEMTLCLNVLTDFNVNCLLKISVMPGT